MSKNLEKIASKKKIMVKVSNLLFAVFVVCFFGIFSNAVRDNTTSTHLKYTRAKQGKKGKVKTLELKGRSKHKEDTFVAKYAYKNYP